MARTSSKSSHSTIEKTKPSVENSYEENIKLVKQAIKIKKEPITNPNEVNVNNNDEDIEMITID